MKTKKLILQLVMSLGLIFILFSYSANVVLAFTTENISTVKDNVKVDFKQIQEIAKPTWGIVRSQDSRDGKISQSLAATIVAIVNTEIVNDGWKYASDMLTWLYPKDTIEQMKSENVSPEQAVAWLNSIGYTASIVNRPLTTDEIKKSLDNSNPIVTIFESQNPANWLEKQTSGVLYAHGDVEAGSQNLHSSFLKTAYHGELQIQDGAEQSSFKFADQYENPDTTAGSTDFKWIKSITDIKKDPSWESRSNIVSNRAAGIFNVDLEKSGNVVTKAMFTDPDVRQLKDIQPKTNKNIETKLAATALINLYFDDQHKKTIKDLDAFAKIGSSQEVSGEQVVSWYKSLGFSCDTISGKLTKELTKSLLSSGKLYLTTYKATDRKNKYQQVSNIGTDFIDNNFGYSPTGNTIIKSEAITPTYSVNWSSPNAYQTYIAKSKNFNYDFFSATDSAARKSLGKYMPSLTVYNIRQKSVPENTTPQFKPTKPDIKAPVKTATYNTNNNFGIRETQGQEPWCSSYVEAAAVNTFRKATDVAITSAQTLMRLNRPGLTDEELSKVSGTTVSDNAKKIKDNYNIGVTIVDRALSFSEVKREIDSGQIIQMDAYNINATTPEEEYGHAFAIVGYVTSSDGDKNKSPYYEVWNPWWHSTFYIPVNNSTFSVAGVNYKWTRSWYRWRQDGVGSIDKNTANKKVLSMANPYSGVDETIIPQNPLLRGQTYYSANLLNNRKNVSTQVVSRFGREITAYGIGAEYGYAASSGQFKGKAIKVRKNSSTKSNYSPALPECLEFKSAIDDLNKNRDSFREYALGTAAIAVLMPIVLAVPGFALGAIIVDVLGGLTGGAFGLAAAINVGLSVKDYIKFSNTASSRFKMIKDETK